MVDEQAVREQFTAAFDGADYPVDGPMDLVPALPNGPATTFEIGDEKITALELYREADDESDFPYDDLDDLVDDLVEGLAERGYL